MAVSFALLGRSFSFPFSLDRSRSRLSRCNPNPRGFGLSSEIVSLREERLRRRSAEILGSGGKGPSSRTLDWRAEFGGEGKLLNADAIPVGVFCAVAMRRDARGAVSLERPDGGRAVLIVGGSAASLWTED